MRTTHHLERLFKILLPRENPSALIDLLGKELIDRLLRQMLMAVCDERKMLICTKYFGIGCEPQTQKMIGMNLERPLTAGAVGQIIWYVSMNLCHATQMKILTDAICAKREAQSIQCKDKNRQAALLSMRRFSR